jgi:1,5-anhydro-D-fructose reductase (1,5-anhydro-D-mannitol-forming)
MTVRWAFVGDGRHAELWMLPAIRAARNCSLIGVWGRRHEKAADFAARYGIERAYSSLRQLVEDDAVDAVYISTPNHLHAEHTIAALEAGKHVLCEKPMAVTISEAERMVLAAQRSGRHLGIGFQLRHHRLIKSVHDQLIAGDFGRVVYVSAQFAEAPSPPPRLDIPHSSWKENQDLVGGALPLMGYGVHVLDLVAYLTDSDVHSITAQNGLHRGDGLGDTFSQVLLAFDSGAHGHIGYGGGFPLSKNDVVIYTEKVRLMLEDVINVHTLGVLHVTREEGAYGWRTQTDCLELPDNYRSQFEAFSAAVGGSDFVGASGLDGLRSVKLTQAVISSQTSGARVLLDNA